jgi:hypothetical protein
MRRIRLFLAVVAVVAGMLAAVPGPAMADDFGDDFDDGFFFDNGFLDNGFLDDGFFNFGGGITLDVSQESESGDVSIGHSVS